MATSIGLHQPAESLALLVAFLKTNMSKATILKWLGLFRYSSFPSQISLILD